MNDFVVLHYSTHLIMYVGRYNYVTYMPVVRYILSYRYGNLAKAITVSEPYLRRPS